MQNIHWKILLILAILGVCAWRIVPPEENIRLGKDLRGGTSLIYKVNIPETATAPRNEIINQMIQVLKDRVDPRGVLDIAMIPLGLDRIEIVMPLPNERVLQLKKDFEDALDDMLRHAQITPNELEVHLQRGDAVERYCGESVDNDRCRRIAGLQNAQKQVVESRQAYEAAEADENTTEAELFQLADDVAVTEETYDALFDQVLSMSLDRARVARALELDTKQKTRKDAEGEVVHDESGEPILNPSARNVALTTIKSEFPNLATDLDTVVARFDSYQGERKGLDDPSDLIRLLEGAGVLEFYITVSPADGLPVDELRAELAEVGPANTTSTIARWFPVNELDQWYDTPAEEAALMADPQAYFQSLNYVAAYHDGQHYLLLYITPQKSLTHRGDSQWTVESTYSTLDRLGRPAVGFGLDPAGGGKMARLTGPHVGKQMAIVLDGQVYSAPTLQSQISSNGIIQGTFSQSELNYLLRVLAAGSLEARLEGPIAMNTLGPSLGKDNLARGKEAFIVALIAVAIFMTIYYFFAGFVAVLALVANGLIIFGFMSLIQGTFTLPGLAGIVLTIGMAVDANVLIYERIREEIFAGEEDIRGCIRLGYAKALSTILDANITNLIVCFVLFYTATAEVKGFAMTLSIGICATLFTTLYVTRVIYTLYTDAFKASSLPMLPTVVPAIHRLLEPSINWIGMRHVFWVISAILATASIAMVWSRGVNLFDTEFRGGVTATMLTATIDENDDGLPDLDADGEPVRRWMSRAVVEQRLRELAQGADPTTAGSPDEANRLAVYREMDNVAVLTVGPTRLVDNEAEAQGFQIKVANPPGLPENVAITDIVVDAVVSTFSDAEIDIRPPINAEGLGRSVPGDLVMPIEDRSLGAVIGDASQTRQIPEFDGGVAILLRNIDPPSTPADILARIEQMRDQPDYRDTAGRKSAVIGLDLANSDGPQTDAVVLSHEPALSVRKIDSNVWYEQLAVPEWNLVSTALQRRSSLQQVSSFSSAVAQTLAANAIVAVVLSLLGILLYIWVRFGSLRYSAAAIVALMHDVTIALGLLALTAFLGKTALGKTLLIDEFRIDLGVVAALLTIIGYSLNDTIVILDRIRENRGKRPLPTAEIVNRSINQTVSRTLLTSVTTLMAVLIMYAAGGSGIRPFTYVLLAGLLVGTYSSVAIASPLVYRGHSDEDES